jgi:hypothetical protein
MDNSLATEVRTNLPFFSIWQVPIENNFNIANAQHVCTLHRQHYKFKISSFYAPSRWMLEH